MEAWQALLYGVVQGITEFLPVSSSGHLRVVQYFTGLEEPQTLFDLGLHAATLLAVMLFFWRDLADMVASPLRVPGLIRRRGIKGLAEDTGLRGVAFLVLASIPTGLIGFTLGKQLEAYAGSIRFVAWAFIINAFILFASQRVVLPMASKTRLNKGFLGIRWLDALVVGCFQGMAVTRGISRSGSTISAGLMMGLDRETAGRFAFLLAIPAILGAELVGVLDQESFGTVDIPMLALGGVAAFVTGLASIKVLMHIVKQGSLHRFGWYTLALGLLLLAWLQWGETLSAQVVEVTRGTL